MGFSLTFMGMRGDTEVGADREGLARFLEQRGLEVGPSPDSTHHLRGPDGDLRFDGSWTDLHLDPLDQEGPVSGGIWHASLTDEECGFIYDMCVAGKMLIFNPQGDPLAVIPGRVLHPLDLPEEVEPGDTAWVDSAEELKDALSGNFERFVQYRDQVIDSQ